MDKKRYSEDYVLRFKLIKTDKNRVAMYNSLQWILKIIIVLFVVSLIDFFLPPESIYKILLSLMRLICILGYGTIAVILKRTNKSGYLIMYRNHFILKNDDKEMDFKLDKLTNLKVKSNEDGYYRGWWKVFFIGMWYVLVNPDGKGNFMEFDYENQHHLYEINLRTFSESLLFERRINEWMRER